MTSAEKVQNCMDVKPIKDRSEIPIYPQLISYPGVYAGITQKDLIKSPNTWLKAMKTTFDHFGYPDVSIPAYLGDIIFGEGLPAKYPGKDLPDDAQFQFVESENMDIEDYKDILANGWDQWYNKYIGRIQNPPLKSNFKVMMRFMKAGMNCGKVCKFMQKHGVEPISGFTTFPLFDTLSLIRSFGSFVMDLYDEPDLIHAILKQETPKIIQTNLKNASHNPIKRMHLYAMRSDMNAISPAIFDEFVYPYLKQLVLGYLEAGYKSVIHADGNWTPILDRFLDLPKGSVHFEFDGVTDLFKASEILDGHHSMRGDVPATMFAYGTPDEISEYCEKLITGIGMKGGFMLGSGCEIPMNCKEENLTAFMKSVRG